MYGILCIKWNKSFIQVWKYLSLFHVHYIESFSLVAKGHRSVQTCQVLMHPGYSGENDISSKIVSSSASCWSGRLSQLVKDDVQFKKKKIIIYIFFS